MAYMIGTIDSVGAKKIDIDDDIVPKLTVNFERSEDYKGEYGFDWFRDYYEGSLVDKSKLEQLKKEFTPTPINGNEYYVPWLAIKPGQSITLKLNIDVLEKIKGKQKKKKIILPDHNSVKFEPSEIEVSEVKKNNTFDVKVICESALNEHTHLAVTLNGPAKKEIGRLNIYKNSIDYNIRIRFVKVITYADKSYTNQFHWEEGDAGAHAKSYESEKDYLDYTLKQYKTEDIIKNRSLNQALINVEIDPKDYTIELDGKSLASDGIIEGYDIKNEKYSRDFPQMLFEKYLHNYENNNKTKDVIIFLSRLQKYATVGTAGGQGSMYDPTGRFCILYNAGLSIPAAYVHELGHIFGCEHSFGDNETDVYISRLQESIKKNETTIQGWEEKIESFKLKINSNKESIKKDLVNIKKMESYPGHPKAINNIALYNHDIKTKKDLIEKAQEQIDELNKHISEREQSNKSKQERLDHCFKIKEKNIYRFNNKKQTSNFMDYTEYGRIDFFKWQWEIMQEDI